MERGRGIRGQRWDDPIVAPGNTLWERRERWPVDNLSVTRSSLPPSVIVFPPLIPICLCFNDTAHSAICRVKFHINQETSLFYSKVRFLMCKAFQLCPLSIIIKVSHMWGLHIKSRYALSLPKVHSPSLHLQNKSNFNVCVSVWVRLFQHVVIPQIFLYEGSLIFGQVLASRLGRSPINNFSPNMFCTTFLTHWWIWLAVKITFWATFSPEY